MVVNTIKQATSAYGERAQNDNVISHPIQNTHRRWGDDSSRKTFCPNNADIMAKVWLAVNAT